MPIDAPIRIVNHPRIMLHPAPQPNTAPPTPQAEPVTCGPYTAWIAPPFDHQPDWPAWLADLPQQLEQGTVLSTGRHRVIHVPHPDPTTQHPGFAVKAFGTQPAWKDRYDRRRGTKALRSFQTAIALHARNVGTPAPLAVAERWHGARLRESYLITRYEADLTDFRAELIRLYRTQPDCEQLMTLLHTVATAVAALHRAGYAHRDLGNQNIALRHTPAAGWHDVQFLDLNRARPIAANDLRARAFDISRITLPSDLLRVFKAMLFGDQPVPAAFDQWEQRYRSRFAFHTRTRAWRHPIRTARQQRQTATNSSDTYPPEKSIWIWDERSAQAISTLTSRDRKRHYPAGNSARIAATVLAHLPRTLPAYRRHTRAAFTTPVDLTGRTGLAVHPRPATWTAERRWLDGLPPLPLLLRFYHHETETEWNYTIDRVNELRAAGYPVSIAMVQDRRAVEDPARWQRFVHHVLNALADTVEWVEVGHAINRVKWGIWTLDELARLAEPFQPFAAGQRGCKLMGPAVIDFEFHYLAAALHRLRAVLPLDAVSLHLYVDRRGAPENRQGAFDTVRKCALAKALAQTLTPDRPVIVSEVNWPLAGTGIYSPVNSPYLTPGPRHNDPNVDADAYARYLTRYLVQTLGSGLIERVYWWRLAAHGFGLIDDHTDQPRPAYHALNTWLRQLGNSTCHGRLPDTPPAVHAYRFTLPSGQHLLLAYTHHPNQPNPTTHWHPPQPIQAITHPNGTTTPTIQLTPTPQILHL
jgi:hypothetical protein